MTSPGGNLSAGGMCLAIGRDELDKLVASQIEHLFVLGAGEAAQLSHAVADALERCEYCFERTDNKYYQFHGRPYFNPFQSAQYCIFLYHLSVAVNRLEGAPATLADRVYYLNRALNGVDLFYEVELPRVFMLDHPLGSVMGRASYGEYFRFAQSCTVGNNHGVYPVIGEHVTMMSGSKIIGACRIGERSIIAANTYICDQDVPPNCYVFGSSPHLIFKARGERLSNEGVTAERTSAEGEAD
jgi:serine O-acetyltransferase